MEPVVVVGRVTELRVDGEGLLEEVTLETLWMERTLPCEGLGTSAPRKRGNKYKCRNMLMSEGQYEGHCHWSKVNKSI